MVHHYLARLDPDGPEPDPTEGGGCPSPSMPTAASPAGSISTRSAGRRCRPRSNRSCRPTGPRGLRTRAQQLADALVQLADNALAAGNLPFLRTVKPHVVVTIGIDDLVDPAHRPRCRPTLGFGARDLRRPGPLAGLRRQHHPDRHRPRRASRSTWAAATRLVPAAPARALDIRDRRLRVRRLLRPHPLVRRPSCPANGLDGGPTSVENAALLCERHHTKVHHGFRIVDNPTADGAPTAPTAPRSSCTPTSSPPDSGRTRPGAVQLRAVLPGQDRAAPATARATAPPCSRRRAAARAGGLGRTSARTGRRSRTARTPAGRRRRRP